MTKRVADLAILLVTCPVWMPILALVALLVRLRLGKPVLFTQLRAGLHGSSFRILKFRTMTEATNAHGQLLPDAERLTRFGKFLRSTSLDELPELWNVLKGEMSLVGPRPLLPEYLPLYSTDQARRHEALPGITGWAQVNGRNMLSWQERLALDVWYIDNRSLRLDLWILLLTGWKVLARDGISQKGHATMEPFTGSTDDR